MTTVNVAWALLVLSGLIDVFWASTLKLADGFARPGWGAISVVLLGVIVVLMGRALKVLPVGTAYAVFTGVGAVGTVLFGIVVFGESAGAARLVCIGIVMAGVFGLKLITA